MKPPEDASRVNEPGNPNAPRLQRRWSRLDLIATRKIERIDMPPPAVQVGHEQVDPKLSAHSET
jgi:hypothetical protein